MRAFSFQFDTDYVSEVRSMLSLRNDQPPDRSAFEQIKQELRGAQIPAFGRRYAPQRWCAAQ